MAVVVRVTILCFAMLITFAIGAHAQRQAVSSAQRPETTQRVPLKLTGSHVQHFAPLSKQSAEAVSVSTPPQASTPQCRPGRRAWMGALIGAGAVIPLAKLAHTRFENEAANGAAVATTTVILGASAGSFIGLASCQ